LRKRNNQFHFYLNDVEAEKLNRRIIKSGLSREAYIRCLLDGLVPKDKPPPDYYSMRRELAAIGNNLNQIARIANATGDINSDDYAEQARAVNAAISRIDEAVREPRRT
jgi:hypothetical protein